jgi:hypothetical protein
VLAGPLRGEWERALAGDGVAQGGLDAPA